MFEIRLLASSQLGPDGQRIGEITIGEFTEKFPCNSSEGTVNEMELRWRANLRRLIAGESAVDLIHDPRFAWIIYREGDCCFVQQKLSVNGEFYPITPRRMHNENGNRISEWTTSVLEIERFLALPRDPREPSSR